MFNSCTFVGRLTREPAESKDTKAELVRAAIAVNDKSGGNDTVMFVDLAVFGKSGAALLRYAHKGDTIAVTGKLSARAYMSHTNEPRVGLDLSVSQWSFVGSKQADSAPASAPVAEQISNDDIPF